MISRGQLRTIARQRGVRQDFAEKDYINSWILWGIYTSDIGSDLLFKGGTALSKLYFPETWRFSEDLDFGVTDQYTGSEEQLQTILDDVTDRSGIGFSLREHHESRQPGYPPHYIDISIRYDAILDQANTTSLDIMVDEYIAFEPNRQMHEYQDVPEFELQAYSVSEIFAEKLRAIVQRGAPRDYYDLYQLLQTESVAVNPDTVLPAFEGKCEHDNLDVDLQCGLPENQREDLRRQWKTTLPDLTGTPPPFDDVWQTLDGFVTGMI